MYDRALLLRARFSRNFGLPLANDILVEMFNRISSIEIKMEILRAIENQNNFEAYYSRKKTESSFSGFKLVDQSLLDVYKKMDKQVLISLTYEHFSYIKVISFLNNFSASMK